MKSESTFIKDLLILQPHIYTDERGFFMESYSKKQFEDLGIYINFVQDNHSKSSYGVLRGLHLQKEPHAQTKLVRVLAGKILDVAVDLRKDSLTFGKWFSIILSFENQKQLLIPKGFAHGFSVLSDKAEVLYKCDEYYFPDSESGIVYNDNTLCIDWQLPKQDMIIKDRDKAFSTFDPQREYF